MDLKVFCNQCSDLAFRLQDNIDSLTQRYVDSDDSPEYFTNSIAPILEQQFKILELVKSFIKL